MLRKLDSATLVGLGLGLLAILGGNYLEGGSLSSLLQPTAALIVFGGTAGATVLQYRMDVLWRALQSLRQVVGATHINLQVILGDLVDYAYRARKDGIVSLDPQLDNLEDPFLRKALALAIDGVDQRMLREAMELELDHFAEDQENLARVFESAGGYSPTLGILGAVLGLIQVMNNLTDPGKLGAGIAVAFVATVYGVGLANLVLLPIAGKLKSNLKMAMLAKEMMLEGVLCIHNGENPRLVERKLLGLLNEAERRSYVGYFANGPRPGTLA